MPSLQMYYNYMHLYLLQHSYNCPLGKYMTYILSFYVQCRDIKESWHKTVLMIDEDHDDGTSKKSVYFGKCVAFLQDSEGKQFVVLRWFTRHEDNGFDMISKVPSFKLAPEGHTKSFSTLPLDAIVNGALMVPGGGRFWALLAPREQMLYNKQFQLPIVSSI